MLVLHQCLPAMEQVDPVYPETHSHKSIWAQKPATQGGLQIAVILVHSDSGKVGKYVYIHVSELVLVCRLLYRTAQLGRLVTGEKGSVTELKLGTYALSLSLSHTSYWSQLRSFASHHLMYWLQWAVMLQPLRTHALRLVLCGLSRQLACCMNLQAWEDGSNSSILCIGKYTFLWFVCKNSFNHWLSIISPTFFTKAAFISIWAFTCHSLHMLYAWSIVLTDVIQTWFKDYKARRMQSTVMCRS